MNKKTRNVLSGILVGLASLYAVINFAELPVNEVGNFLLSTALLILGIVLLALITVFLFKLPGMLKNKLVDEKEHDVLVDDADTDKPQVEADKEG